MANFRSYDCLNPEFTWLKIHTEVDAKYLGLYRQINFADNKGEDDLIYYCRQNKYFVVARNKKTNPDLNLRVFISGKKSSWSKIDTYIVTEIDYVSRSSLNSLFFFKSAELERIIAVLELTTGNDFEVSRSLSIVTNKQRFAMYAIIALITPIVMPFYLVRSFYRAIFRK